MRFDRSARPLRLERLEDRVLPAGTALLAQAGLLSTETAGASDQPRPAPAPPHNPPPLSRKDDKQAPPPLRQLLPAPDVLLADAALWALFNRQADRGNVAGEMQETPGMAVLAAAPDSESAAGLVDLPLPALTLTPLMPPDRPVLDSSAPADAPLGLLLTLRAATWADPEARPALADGRPATPLELPTGPAGPGVIGREIGPDLDEALRGLTLYRLATQENDFGGVLVEPPALPPVDGPSFPTDSEE